LILLVFIPLLLGEELQGCKLRQLFDFIDISQVLTIKDHSQKKIGVRLLFQNAGTRRAVVKLFPLY